MFDFTTMCTCCFVFLALHFVVVCLVDSSPTIYVGSYLKRQMKQRCERHEEKNI